ncbi:MAG: hypothetical protein C4332_02715 [Meiothermus sp.]
MTHDPFCSDAEDFLQTGNTQLWRGVYLHDLGQGSDASVSDSLYHALRKGTEALLDAEPEEALRLGRILLEANPYDSQALALGLKALRRSRDANAAGRFYAAYRLSYAEVGERLPERRKDFLEVTLPLPKDPTAQAQR